MNNSDQDFIHIDLLLIGEAFSNLVDMIRRSHVQGFPDVRKKLWTPHMAAQMARFEDTISKTDDPVLLTVLREFQETRHVLDEQDNLLTIQIARFLNLQPPQSASEGRKFEKQMTIYSSTHGGPAWARDSQYLSALRKTEEIALRVGELTAQMEERIQQLSQNSER